MGINEINNLIENTHVNYQKWDYGIQATTKVQQLYAITTLTDSTIAHNINSEYCTKSIPRYVSIKYLFLEC